MAYNTSAITDTNKLIVDTTTHLNHLFPFLSKVKNQRKNDTIK
jgi:hypothetical protein